MKSAMEIIIVVLVSNRMCW